MSHLKISRSADLALGDETSAAATEALLAKAWTGGRDRHELSRL